MASGTIQNNTGVEVFNLTSSLSGFKGRGVYDRATKTVRLYCSGSYGSNISASTVLFVVPSGYRPSAQKEGLFLGTTSSGQVAGNLHVQDNGDISQGETNMLRSLFGYAEYQLD